MHQSRPKKGQYLCHMTQPRARVTVSCSRADHKMGGRDLWEPQKGHERGRKRVGTRLGCRERRAAPACRNSVPEQPRGPQRGGRGPEEPRENHEQRPAKGGRQTGSGTLYGSGGAKAGPVAGENRVFPQGLPTTPYITSPERG